MGTAGLTTSNPYVAWTLLGVSIIALCVASWATGRNYAEVQKLKNEVKSYEQENESLRDTIESLKKIVDDSQNGDCKATKKALDRMLKTFAIRILTNVRAQYNPHIRVTLYGRKISIGGKHVFIPLTRYSYNPQLEKMGRKTYPDDEGFIRKVWENGAYTWKSISKNRKERKKEFVDEFNMPMSTVEKLTMIPCSMAGIRLENADGEKLGLLILESNDEGNMNYLITRLDKLKKERGMIMCVSEAIGSLGPYLEILAK